ncbi:MAG: TIGR00159 family protein [Ruminococcaceae bacterium]|nr:TIGR00159 family protein [Oscillospiraceae bacterium]
MSFFDKLGALFSGGASAANPVTTAENLSFSSQIIEKLSENESLSSEFVDFVSKSLSIDFGFFDFLDICFVAFILYNGIKLIRETRAFQLVKGLLLLGVIYLIINMLNMEASSYIFEFIFKNIFIILVILFQQEIRQVIEKVGTSKFTSISLLLKGNNVEKNKVVSDAVIEISKAVQRMSDSKTGSLIVMEKELLLGDVISTGTPVDAKVTHELVGNIFFPNSPLHDGAAVVRDGRLLCAGCVLPLTKNQNISSDLGTRHRAAMGMSEQSDAIVIVTSEETGIISVAVGGELTRNLTESELREKLIDYLIENGNENVLSGEGGVIKKLFKGKKK